MKEQIEHIAKVIHDSDIADINTFPISMSECLGKHGARRTGAAIAVFNAGYRKQVWISVDDRLPDKGQEVLAYRGDFNGDMMNTYTYLGSENWEDDYGYRGSTEHEGITHWMPLPQPPEKKGGAK